MSYACSVKQRAINLVDFSSYIEFMNSWYNCLNITSLLLTVYVKLFSLVPVAICSTGSVKCVLK